MPVHADNAIVIKLFIERVSAQSVGVDVQGVADRDQIVVQRVRTRGVPLAIIAGGGFTRTAASVVAHSLLNLYHLGLISGPDAGLCPAASLSTGAVLRLKWPKFETEGPDHGRGFRGGDRELPHHLGAW